MKFGPGPGAIDTRCVDARLSCSSSPALAALVENQKPQTPMGPYNEEIEQDTKGNGEYCTVYSVPREYGNVILGYKANHLGALRVCDSRCLSETGA